MNISNVITQSYLETYIPVTFHLFNTLGSGEDPEISLTTLQPNFTWPNKCSKQRALQIIQRFSKPRVYIGLNRSGYHVCELLRVLSGCWESNPAGEIVVHVTESECQVLNSVHTERGRIITDNVMRRSGRSSADMLIDEIKAIVISSWCYGIQYRSRRRVLGSFGRSHHEETRRNIVHAHHISD